MRFSFKLSYRYLEFIYYSVWWLYTKGQIFMSFKWGDQTIGKGEIKPKYEGYVGSYKNGEDLMVKEQCIIMMEEN